MRLWHDDIREGPDGWVWARTNAEAKTYLATGTVEIASLDHDLGYEGVHLPADPDELTDVLIAHHDPNAETGLDLVRWMIDTGFVPPVIRIHSWNPAGAQAMARALIDSNMPMQITVEPFRT